MHIRTKTDTIYHKLSQVIPGGVNSPVRAFKEVDMNPMVVERGEKDCIYDIDGNCFIDYCGSWGALIHGHAHPDILNAVQKRMSYGTSFGITTEIEEKLATKVVELVDSIDKIRFVCSGTEATMTAARIARGYTNRSTIVKFNGNYHGHADFFLVRAGSGVANLSSTSSSKGIPDSVVEDMVSLPYNNLDVARQFLRTHQVAAVILEPIAGNMGVVPAHPDFIRMLREETAKQKALLIFDEVITGFRVALGGAQSLYNTSPDLTCLGKVVAGGFPAAAVGGKKEIMDTLAPIGPVYQAGTLAGNPLAMEAGLQALQMCQKPKFYDMLKEKTDVITVPVREKILSKQINASIQQVGSMFTLFLGQKTVENQDNAKNTNQREFSSFFKYMYENGVYIPPSQHEAWFVSSVHSFEHLTKTRDLILKFLK